MVLFQKNQNYSIPNLETNDGKSSVMLANVDSKGTLSYNALKGSSRLVIGVYNNYNEPVTVAVRLDYDGTDFDFRIEGLIVFRCWN